MRLTAGAMRRPISALVAVASIALLAWVALGRMRVDILPNLGTPIIYVAQPYGGLDPGQMEAFVTSYYEYHFLYINGIEHVESKSVQGVALIKLFFHPGTDMAQALAETIAYVNRSRAFMPPGTVPPFVTRFDAGGVPVGSLVFSSETRSLGELQDLALFKVRPLFSTLPGVSAPPPFGGQQRTMVVRVDPERLRAYGMSPDEVVRAIASGNIISPAGAVRIGDRMPLVPVDSVVANIKDLAALPLRGPGNGGPVFLRDVGDVKDSADIATGYALVNGRRTVYIPVTKRADASTLSVVAEVRKNLPKFQALLPEDIRISYQFDQSPYVRRAMQGLALEGLLGAVLTGLMVLLFLRDPRSALIVVTTIPIALLASVVALWLCGQTLNVMTLGGLALAVGILVDEATVDIENIHTHLARGKRKALAALEATEETRVPRLLAMLSVLAVFIPSFLMVGVARALFVPLALAVGFTMIASFFLSSTLVPVLATWLLREGEPAGAVVPEKERRFSFAAGRGGYGRLVERLVAARWLAVGAYALVAGLVLALVGPRLGTEIFPAVDNGQLRLRLRAESGTRIERTEEHLRTVLAAIERRVGAGGVAGSLAFVGVQPSSYPVNTIHLWTSGPEEAMLQVQLHRPGRGGTEALKEALRGDLAAALPGVRISFEPADIVGQVMSFGANTPIEIAVAGPKLSDDRDHAEKIRLALARLPALRDLQFGQSLDYPTLAVTIDRERAGLAGVTAQDVARATVAATSSSRFTEPNYWRDPNTGVAYQVQVQVPIERMDSAAQIENLPVARAEGPPVLLRSVARVRGSSIVGEYDRYNMQRMVTLTANVSGQDLGTTGRQIQAALRQVGAPPKRVTVTVRGQLDPLAKLLESLRGGLLASIVVIFLLLAASFQSLRLAAATLATVPAVLAGVAVALWVTGTTLNMQSFTGAIMAIGVAVANAVLLVSFAERARAAGMPAGEAASEAASSRFRPILMTGMAMIAGMVPMALALGEGGAHTAPLGRAVIGGLIGATLATLFVLPAVFTLLQSGIRSRSASLDPHDPESRHYAAASA